MKLSTPLSHRSLFLTLTLPIIGLLVASIFWPNSHNRPGVSPSTNSNALEAYGRIPLSFEANRGQTDASVNYLARGAGYTLFLKPTEAVFVLNRTGSITKSPSKLSSAEPAAQMRSTEGSEETSEGETLEPAKVLRMKLAGADEAAVPQSADELPGKVNYFTGNDPSQWRAEVPTYARVRYGQVYRGVDVVYYGNQRQLEYDFVVAPATDPDKIKLQFEGVDKVEVNDAGDLLLSLGESVVRQPKPVVYQEIGGERRVVEGSYTLGENREVGFAIGVYDSEHPLVIDPVLVYSTYLGGSATDEALGFDVDSSGNLYVCGSTASTNFPTANAFDSTFNAGNAATDRDAFVAKLNATGSALVYSTYLGGTGNNVNLSGDDICNGIAVDVAGNAYLAGQTRSTDFPTANAVQGTYGGGLSDAFVTKLNAAGSAIAYSTFLGGTVFEAGAGVDVDAAGNAYVTGRTTSTNFPTANAIQPTFAAGAGGADAFVTKFNAAGTAFVYSTYLGGSSGATGFDAGFSIVVDAAGNAYVTGQTSATNFPTANAIQATFGGGAPDGDAFVTKINAAGSAFAYSTYLGGSDNDVGSDIAVDASGNAVVSGFTSSSNLPTANALDATLSGTQDGFVTKLTAAGNAFVFSTYLGGTTSDACNDVGLDSSGNVYVVGGTNSTDFPTLNPTQAANAGGTGDAFLSKLNPGGSALVYSTYLGGSGFERGNVVAVDSAGSAYVGGLTDSTNFPTLGAVQAANGGGLDAFVTKISDPAPIVSTFQFSQASYPVIEEVTSITVTVTRAGDTSAAATVDYATADGTASERTDYTTALGTLRFAAGETSKTFEVLVNEDSKVEALENFTVGLSNPTGGTSLGIPASASIVITDDLAEPSDNAIDDPNIFVGQHYHDFLNRQADANGMAFWVGQITSCGSDPGCISFKRTNVSTAFFLSIEFQQTGYLVFRIYKETFTDSVGRPRGMPRYREFLRDTQEIGRGVTVGLGNWETLLAANKQAFAERWVQSPEFLAEFPNTLTAEQFVDKLFVNSEVTPSVGERNAAIAAFGIGDVAGRAAALLNVADSFSVYNRQYNPAFVLAQYIGYLRRNPNDAPEPGLNYAGFDFWLNKMNQFSLPGEDVRDHQVALARVQRAEMVRAFLTSGEYRGRFGP